MMVRIVNAPPGVASAVKLQKDYALHKYRVKTMKKYDDSGQLKPVYTNPKFKAAINLNKSLASFSR